MLGDSGAGEGLDVDLRLVRDQRQHDHLAGLLFLLGDQVVERLLLVWVSYLCWTVPHARHVTSPPALNHEG